jgi:hypothetical protein
VFSGYEAVYFSNRELHLEYKLTYNGLTGCFAAMILSFHFNVDLPFKKHRPLRSVSIDAHKIDMYLRNSLRTNISTRLLAPFQIQTHCDDSVLANAWSDWMKRLWTVCNPHVRMSLPTGLCSTKYFVIATIDVTTYWFAEYKIIFKLHV